MKRRELQQQMQRLGGTFTLERARSTGMFDDAISLAERTEDNEERRLELKGYSRAATLRERERAPQAGAA